MSRLIAWVKRNPNRIGGTIWVLFFWGERRLGMNEADTFLIATLITVWTAIAVVRPSQP